MTRTWRILFALAFIGAVTLALLPHPPDPLPVSDKAKHMAAFGTLTLLALLGWPAMPRLRIAERLSFVGALIEVFQSIPALGRDCDVMDWLADTYVILGVVLVTWIITRPTSAPAATP